MRSAGQRVLVIENDPVVRHVIEKLLAARGHLILTAPSVYEAMALLLDFPGPIDVALIDFVLPGMGGMTYAEQLRRKFPPIRIVGMVRSDEVPEMAPSDARSAVLLKPFEAAELFARVEGNA